MVRKWKQMHTADRMKHILLYMIGVGIMPLGVVLKIHAHLGSGGYDALNFALADRLGINTSFAIYGTALVVLLFTALIRGSIPHFATFISSFLLGLFTDLWKWILRDVEGTSILTSILLMVTGLLVIGFAVACYVISIFPTNPTDDFGNSQVPPLLMESDNKIICGICRENRDHIAGHGKPNHQQSCHHEED